MTKAQVIGDLRAVWIEWCVRGEFLDQWLQIIKLSICNLGIRDLPFFFSSFSIIIALVFMDKEKMAF